MRFRTVIGGFKNNSLLYFLFLAAWHAASPEMLGAETIKGTIRLAGAPIVQKAIPTTIDQYICGKEKPAEDLIISPDKGIRNAVVSLAKGRGLETKEADPSAVELDQKECTFVPHVVVAPINSPVLFLNTDRLLHNLHSTSKSNPRFNRAQPKGRTIQITFKSPEIVQIECDLHTWMSAWIVVADHSFYTVTKEHGEFILDNVPPGSYTLRVWQESLGTVTKEVTVAPTVGADVTIEMSAAKLP
jgi:plastocyanin